MSGRDRWVVLYFSSGPSCQANNTDLPSAARVTTIQFNAMGRIYKRLSWSLVKREARRKDEGSAKRNSQESAWQAVSK